MPTHNKIETDADDNKINKDDREYSHDPLVVVHLFDQPIPICLHNNTNTIRDSHSMRFGTWMRSASEVRVLCVFSACPLSDLGMFSGVPRVCPEFVQSVLFVCSECAQSVLRVALIGALQMGSSTSLLIKGW